MDMQPSEQVADLGGQPRGYQVRRHPVDPLVEPQPAGRGMRLQWDTESAAGAGQAAGQPDAWPPPDIR